MPEVIVMRTGSPFYYGSDGSPMGERDTVGTWTYLRDCFNAKFIGAIAKTSNGDSRGIIPIDVKGLGSDSRNVEVYERVDAVIDQVQDAKVAVVIEGATPTWASPDNPNFANVFGFGVRYTLPTLYILHKLKIPRISVITDPKVYPRELDMCSVFPTVKPAAVLSQETCTWDRRIFGKRIRTYAVHSGCEFWCTWAGNYKQYLKPKFDITTCAHAHLKLDDERLRIWRDIIQEGIVFHNLTAKICGREWYGWNEGIFCGTVPTYEDVLNLLSQGYCGPMIPQKTGFNTTKPRMHALMGNVPLFYGRGEEFTYDMDCRLASFDSPCRFTSPDSLKQAVQYAKNHRREITESLCEKTRPDFTMLNDCIAEAVAGSLPLYDTFGGYQQL